MGVDALSAFTVTLGGTPLTVMPKPRDGRQRPAGPGYSGAYVAQDSTRTLERRDVPIFIRRFSRGLGFVERRDEGDDGGYAWASDMNMWLGPGVTTSGRRSSKGLGLGLGYGAGNVSILDSRYFAGFVWAIANNGKILRYTHDPSVTAVEHPPAGTFVAGTGFRAGFSPIAMEVFADNAGVPSLYVSCVGGGGAWRMYEYTATGVWSESPVLGFAVYKMASVWWEGRDGVGAQRLAIATDLSVVRHCIYGSDPLLAASYVTPVTVGNPASTIMQLVAAPEHLFVVKTDGIHDFNEIRSWNLTPYWAETSSASQGLASKLLGAHVFAQRNAGVDRYDLRLDGAQQRFNGECGPGMFLQDGHPLRGYINQFGEHDGWLLGALYNPELKTTYILRAADREKLRIDCPNPMVWHGSEQDLNPVSGRSVRVTNMRVVPADPGTINPSGGAMLWMWVTVGFESANYDCDLYYAPLPTGSGPLSLQASGGTFTHNTTGRLYMTAQNWDDRNATKSVRRYDLVSRRTTVQNWIQIYSRSEGDPSTILDQNTWTPQGEANADSASLTPVTGITGKGIALQAILNVTSPYTAAPIFHELSPRARVARELFDTRELYIVLERGTETEIGSVDPRDGEEKLAAVVALQNQAGPTTYVDELKRSYTVYVEQGITYDRERVDDNDWVTYARVELSLVA